MPPLTNVTREGYTFYTTPPNAAGINGCGLAVAKRFKGCLSGGEITPINDRIMVVRIKQMTLMVTYGPTNEADCEDKERFDDTLRGVLEKCRTRTPLA